jgi:hypothetical protein
MKEFKYERLFKLTGQSLLKKELPRTLKEYGYNIQKKGSMYLYAKGEIPVMLIAHADTVHRERPDLILFDRNQQIIWSPQGIGGDDRAGILGILKIIEHGYRPHILFTDGEEVGGIGAEEAALAIKNEVEKFRIKYLIEIDRKGKNDAVFYNSFNADFIEYVQGFGFIEDIGSFSDISILMPKWNLAGVNLSAGYYNAHTLTEYVKLEELWLTVKRVEEMLKRKVDKSFEYEEKYYKYSKWYDDQYLEDYYKGSSKTYKRNKNNTSLINKNKTNNFETKNNYKKETFQYKGYTYNEFVYKGINIEIDPENLSSLYGGTPFDWNKFLKDNKYKIEKDGFEVIIDYIFETYNNDIVDMVY